MVLLLPLLLVVLAPLHLVTCLRLRMNILLSKLLVLLLLLLVLLQASVLEYCRVERGAVGSAATDHAAGEVARIHRGSFQFE